MKSFVPQYTAKTVQVFNGFNIFIDKHKVKLITPSKRTDDKDIVIELWQKLKVDLSNIPLSKFFPILENEDLEKQLAIECLYFFNIDIMEDYAGTINKTRLNYIL